MDISVLLAMDFSLSNGHYKNKASLHYMPSSIGDQKYNEKGELISARSINVENLNRGGAKTTTRVEQLIKR